MHGSTHETPTPAGEAKANSDSGSVDNVVQEPADAGASPSLSDQQQSASAQQPQQQPPQRLLQPFSTSVFPHEGTSATSATAAGPSHLMVSSRPSGVAAPSAAFLGTEASGPSAAAPYAAAPHSPAPSAAAAAATSSRSARVSTIFDQLEGQDIPLYVRTNDSTLTFPEKLMLMLMHMEREYSKSGKKREDAPIVWAMDGTAFVIRQRDPLTSHWLPLFFRQSKFSSFTRKLYRWGFRQVSMPRDIIQQDYRELVFGNANFQRDKAYLLKEMSSVTAAASASARRREEAEADYLALEEMKQEPRAAYRPPTIRALPPLPEEQKDQQPFPPPSSASRYASSSSRTENENVAGIPEAEVHPAEPSSTQTTATMNPPYPLQDQAPDSEVLAAAIQALSQPSPQTLILQRALANAMAADAAATQQAQQQIQLPLPQGAQHAGQSAGGGLPAQLRPQHPQQQLSSLHALQQTDLQQLLSAAQLQQQASTAAASLDQQQQQHPQLGVLSSSAAARSVATLLGQHQSIPTNVSASLPQGAVPTSAAQQLPNPTDLQPPRQPQQQVDLRILAQQPASSLLVPGVSTNQPHDVATLAQQAQAAAAVTAASGLPQQQQQQQPDALLQSLYTLLTASRESSQQSEGAAAPQPAPGPKPPPPSS